MTLSRLRSALKQSAAAATYREMERANAAVWLAVQRGEVVAWRPKQ